MNYDYEVQFRSTKLHGNADMLSRLPKKVTPTDEGDEYTDRFSLSLEEALLNGSVVARETRRDPILSKVLGYQHHAWPDRMECSGAMQAVWNRRTELQ